jgi:hypothetical protein
MKRREVGYRLAEISQFTGKEPTYPNPSLHLINFFGREGNINLT